jgi:hypothetical protein
MDRQVNEDARLALETVETSELTRVSGGIWKYTSRLGAAGQQMEDRVVEKYGVKFTPSTLEEAAGQALQNWVSIP